MIRILILLSFIATVVASANAQGPICPDLKVFASASAVTRGDKVTFNASVKGGNFDLTKVEYKWFLEPEAKIVGGQDTPIIVIDTTKVQTDHLTATIALGSLGQCPQTMSQSVRILGQGNGVGYGQGSGHGSGSGGTGTPPTPASYAGTVRILSKPAARATTEACDAEFSGSVMLRVTFLKTGEIGAISVIKGAPYGLNEQAIESAKHLKFEPALVNGVPTTVTKSVEYHFNCM